jgi:hypothetical protein
MGYDAVLGYACSMKFDTHSPRHVAGRATRTVLAREFVSVTFAIELHTQLL